MRRPGRTSDGCCGPEQRPRLPPGRVAAMQDQDVAVRVLEVRHMADAGIDRLAEELDALARQLGARRFDVVDAQRDRAAVRRELATDRGRVEDLQRQIAGLELAAGDPPVFLGLLEAESAA